jgi:hypothetical protein
LCWLNIPLHGYIIGNLVAFLLYQLALDSDMCPMYDNNYNMFREIEGQ